MRVVTRVLHGSSTSFSTFCDRMMSIEFSHYVSGLLSLIISALFTRTK